MHLDVYFSGKLTKPYNNAKTFMNFSRTDSKYYQQIWQVLWKFFFFYKMASCSHHCPLRHPTPSLEHWYIRNILSDQRPWPEQSDTFLERCSPVDNWHCIESPESVLKFSYTEKAFIFTIYDYVLRTFKKNVLFVNVHTVKISICCLEHPENAFICTLYDYIFKNTVQILC